MTLNQVPEPLAYAEALLGRFTRLSQAVDDTRLLDDFVCAVAELSGCELAQLYLLDASHTRLAMSAECLNGTLQCRAPVEPSADYSNEQLLQLALSQSRVVCLGALGDSLYETGFLPPSSMRWQSLLCVPVFNHEKVVQGVLVCASHDDRNLQGFADSLGQLGSFVLGQRHQLRRLNRSADEYQMTQAGVQNPGSYGMVGKSASLRHACAMIGKVLNSSYTVLLQGETGTGKEVVARAIHDLGPRRSKAFIVQNCAALPENLLESELFGYRKGAFTGAESDRKGLFDAANHGTLLLDEIGDMPLSVQATLLRVLQEREIRPLGSNVTHKIDVRILAATHRDLWVLVNEGKFREDLYYRLAQFPIELPPLRQREGDIPELAQYFAKKTCASLQREPLNWSVAALDHLSGHAFPGNVRELKGLVERAVLLCEGDQLLTEHFALRALPVVDESHLNLRDRLEQTERRLLLECLRRNNGNQSACARELGLPRRTLLYRLERLKINLGDCNG